MTTILKQFQATPPPASVKAVKEICVTCGAAVNYNQGNSGYRPLGVANQIQQSGFAQPNVQNNQNWFSQPQGYNRGNNFNQDQSYQAPTQQNQVVPLSELEKVKRMNEANMKSMQTQINNVKDELRNEMKNSIQASMSNQTNELKNMMASFFQMNTASTSGSGHLPSNTIANPKGELKAITTRSGIVLDGTSIPIPPPFINPEEDKRVEETLTDQDLAEYTIKVPPPLKMLKALLSNKEKLLELANTPLNENYSAVILKKLPEKLGDPGKFLILCGFSELNSHFPTDFVVVDYESDPRVPLILGRPFLRTARALIDVHREEMILREDDIFDPEGDIVLDPTKDLPPPHNINPLSGSTTSSSPNHFLEDTTSSSPNHFLEEFAAELALITFPPRNDDLSFDIESDLKEIEYFLNHDPIKEMDSILEDSIDKGNLVEPNVNHVDTIHEMFTDGHALDYSSPPIYDEYDDDLDEFNDFFLSPEYASFLFEDFSEVDALPSTNNEDKSLELMLSKRSRKNTKCVNAADEELTAAKHKLMLLVYW
nr:hypothetical protein [Tanacetum cinerariifolium]